MAEIIWTDQALEDIETITEYISRDSFYYAQMTVRKIFETVNRISLFPKSGRVVPELEQENMKEFILGNYRIIYRIKKNIVEIITIYHSARLLNTDVITKHNS
jgi:addiction module RelE/StbE family toxin